jgi:hypothetical protein
VNTSEYAAVAAAHNVDPDRWESEFSAVLDRIAPRFRRYEPLRHAAELMAGMVSGLDRKNCWTAMFISAVHDRFLPTGLAQLADELTAPSLRAASRTYRNALDNLAGTTGLAA